MRLLTYCNLVLWQWLLPVLLVLTAVVCAVRTHGIPVRGFCRTQREIITRLLRRDETKQRRIFASALAATMGTGNLTGTALALMTGGAGALFWMWISALLGMVLAYAENVLGLRFRRILSDGTVIGGALGCLKYGVRSKAAAGFFGLCCFFASLGMGNMAQSSSIAQTARRFGVSAPAAGVVTALLLLVVLCGGRERIGRVAAWLMPLLCGFYLVGCGIILLRNIVLIPDAILRVFREAFGLRAAGCGISASAFLHSFSIGLRRGIFSHEAGLGSSGLLHMDAETDADTQGKWASAEVFADTVIFCTATALVLLTAPEAPYLNAGNAAGWLLHAFTAGLGGCAGCFLAICMILLAFATMIGWFHCGASCARYLFGGRADAFFPALYVLAAFAGALGSPEWIWAFCDCCNGLMALPNLYAMLRLSDSLE
ncbi:MAG: sodium:alanine symporter family protein [Oscillospiraceae bacterium]|nr:sodium:alanine symporter family protein [Oscillospiraceae bacterium]